MYAARGLHVESGRHGHAAHAVEREDLKIQLDPGASGRVGARNGERRRTLRLLRSHTGRLAQRAGGLLFALWLPFVAAAGEPTVIVLSWDGTRWDYPDRTELPALARLAREGVRAERLIPVFPSSTFPNHVSLATGTHVDRHGIVNNRFRDTQRGTYDYSDDASWIEAEPVWVTAERQGVRAATFFWVGAQTDWNGVGASHRVAPFSSDTPESEKVDQILVWLDLPEPERPQLILSWWHGADSIGHRYGPDHERVTQALARQDAELARLLHGLDEREVWPHTTLLVVSDHGMAAVEGAVEVLSPLEVQGIGARVVRGGGVGWITLDDPTRLSEALESLNALDGLAAYPSADLPAGLRAYHARRTGHITVIPAAPFAVYTPRGFAARTYLAAKHLLGGATGMHGYPPDNPDMHAVFFAMGRGIPTDLSLGAVRTIDVAPTVTHLLGISPPRDAEGRPIAGIGVGTEVPTPAAGP
jgi:predicted AlkP superfamily pyrophosphatase or phosphodiesterase